MEKIISDYRKTHRGTLIKYWAMTVLMTLGLSMAVLGNKKLLIPAIAVSAYFVIISLFGTLEITVNEPARFRKKLEALPESDRNGIISQYEKSAKFRCKRFLDEYLLFYLNRKIMLVRFDEMQSAEPKGFKLAIGLSGGRMTVLPLYPDENPAVIVAALRSKNPDISVLINGKVVESMEKRKSE